MKLVRFSFLMKSGKGVWNFGKTELSNNYLVRNIDIFVSRSYGGRVNLGGHNINILLLLTFSFGFLCSTWWSITQWKYSYYECCLIHVLVCMCNKFFIHFWFNVRFVTLKWDCYIGHVHDTHFLYIHLRAQWAYWDVKCFQTNDKNYNCNNIIIIPGLDKDKK